MSDISTNYVEGPGGYYNPVDRSGPYTLDSTGKATLLNGATTRRQFGYQQITSLASATTPTVPVGATVAIVTVEGAAVRWRADGTAQLPRSATLSRSDRRSR